MKIRNLNLRIGLILISASLILLTIIEINNYTVYFDELKHKLPDLESKIIKYQSQIEINTLDVSITTEIHGNIIHVPVVMYVYKNNIIYDTANSDIYYNRLYMQYELVNNHLENMSFWEYCKYSHRMNL